MPILSIILAYIWQVENRHYDHHIEHISVVSAGSIHIVEGLSEERGAVPVVGHSRVDVWVGRVVVSVLKRRLRVEVWTCKANSIHHADHVDRQRDNLFQHLSRNDVLVSALRRAI